MKEMHPHAVVVVLLQGGGELVDHGDFKARFFAALADGSHGRRFARLDLTAGKLPQSGERHTRGPQPDKEPAPVFDDGNGDRRWRHRGAFVETVFFQADDLSSDAVDKVDGLGRKRNYFAPRSFAASSSRPGEPMML